MDGDDDALIDNQETDATATRPDDGQDATQETKVYKRRWYLLFLFSVLCGTQGGVWNTWGPLGDSVKEAFDWSYGTVALMTNWGPIAYIIIAPLSAWVMDTKGMRVASISIVILCTVGTGVRCITATPPAATWLCHVGQLLNGLAGPVAMGGGPVFSSAWFPADQRTTATAIAATTNALGVAVTFFLGPVLVRDVSSNKTLNITNVEEVRHDILRYMYIQFGWTALILLLILVYFPARPPTPPSTTASIKRVSFKEGILKLLRHKYFWMLGVPYSLALGVANCWVTVLQDNLSAKGISQVESGMLGFYQTLAGVVAGLTISRFSDIFKRRMKLYLLVLFSTAAIFYLVFTLAYEGYLISFSKVLMYICIISGAAALNACAPLFYELCCETTYPIAEGATNSLLTTVNNITGLIFLLPFSINDHLGKSWMNWTMVGSVVVCLPVLAAFQENYTRLNIDDNSNNGCPREPRSINDSHQNHIINNDSDVDCLTA